MGILAWIVIGIIAGWIAEQVTKTSMGLMMNLVIGVVGAFVGGFLMSIIGGQGITGFNIWSLIVATLGAIVLILIVNAVRRKT